MWIVEVTADGGEEVKLIEDVVRRWGEAENPGPPITGAIREDAGAMTVDEAWEEAKNDPQWTPAWKLWSRQVVAGTRDGKPNIVLRSPHDWEAREEEEARGVWEEEELEAFLQQCELEAGWRDNVDEAQGVRLAQEWREWEAEMTISGIQCPRLEAGEEGGEAAQEVVEAEVMEPLALRGPAKGEEVRRGDRRSRRRWKPVQVRQLNGEPSIDESNKEEEAAEVSRSAGEEQAEAEEVPAPPREQARRTSCSRPRGRRQRGAPAQEFIVDVVTFNGSGAPQLLEAMSTLAGNKASLAALLVQEHHASGDSLADLQAGARARGLKLAPCEATAGKGGGWSAGVGVAAPTHRGWGGISAAQWDLSPVESPGRLAGAWLQAGPRGGMAVLSIYCWASEGMSARNVSLVCRALEVAAACGSAWLIGGDFNVTPSELVATVGSMLDRAGAAIRAPPQPTCYPAAGTARTLDYFLVDARAAAAVSQAEVVEEVVGANDSQAEDVPQAAASGMPAAAPGATMRGGRRRGAGWGVLLGGGMEEAGLLHRGRVMQRVRPGRRGGGGAKQRVFGEGGRNEASTSATHAAEERCKAWQGGRRASSADLDAESAGGVGAPCEEAEGWLG